MTDLADDIARIAALRGQSLESVQAKERERRRIWFDDVASLFGPMPGPAAEFAAMERLCEASRNLIHDAPETMSACRYLAMVERHGEQVVLLAVQHFMPRVIAGYAKQNYGADHPQASE